MGLELLNSEQTVARLHSIIKEAKKELCLVSPYLKLDENDRMTQSIRLARSNGVQVMVVTRIRDDGEIEDASQETERAIEALAKQGLHFRFVPWLHSKLYWSESAMLMTSLNLLSSSIQKSIEVGIYSQAPEDVASARRYYKNEIEPFARKLESRAPAGKLPQVRRGQGHVDLGFCLRCGDEMEFNLGRPYCSEHWKAWSRYQNDDYEDSFCHECGGEYPASRRRPRCDECFAADRA